MSESNKHARLVDALVKWINAQWDEAGFLILRDTVEAPLPARPMAIGGFVPDVFAISAGSPQTVIVGEAKTKSDFDSARSQGQIRAFVEFCREREHAIFTLAVPWDISVYARISLRHLRSDCDAMHVTAFVIDEQGFCRRV